MIQPFTIDIEDSETGKYMATSNIFYAFEVEATPSQARESYLRSLVEDIIWFQGYSGCEDQDAACADHNGLDHATTQPLTVSKGTLSLSLLEEYRMLRHYIRII